VNVAYKLTKMDTLITYYRFVPILEKVSVASVLQVICDGVASQKPQTKSPYKSQISSCKFFLNPQSELIMRIINLLTQKELSSASLRNWNVGIME
jgi:hypothetical protein